MTGIVIGQSAAAAIAAAPARSRMVRQRRHGRPRQRGGDRHQLQPHADGRLRCSTCPASASTPGYARRLACSRCPGRCAAAATTLKSHVTYEDERLRLCLACGSFQQLGQLRRRGAGGLDKPCRARFGCGPTRTGLYVLQRVARGQSPRVGLPRPADQLRSAVAAQQRAAGIGQAKRGAPRMEAAFPRAVAATPAEVQVLNQLRAVFDSIDANGDGAVSKDELAACFRNNPGLMQEAGFEQLVAIAGFNPEFHTFGHLDARHDDRVTWDAVEDHLRHGHKAREARDEGCGSVVAMPCHQPQHLRGSEAAPSKPAERGAPGSAVERLAALRARVRARAAGNAPTGGPAR